MIEVNKTVALLKRYNVVKIRKINYDNNMEELVINSRLNRIKFKYSLALIFSKTGKYKSFTIEYITISPTKGDYVHDYFDYKDFGFFINHIKKIVEKK